MYGLNGMHIGIKYPLEPSGLSDLSTSLSEIKQTFMRSVYLQGLDWHLW